MQTPTIQTYKRPFQPSHQTNQESIKQPYRPRQPFPPRGTMPPRPMKATATSYNYNEEIDYNDIQALRAFAARVQGSQHDEEGYNQHPEAEQEETNPQDADWDPDQAS